MLNDEYRQQRQDHGQRGHGDQQPAEFGVVGRHFHLSGQAIQHLARDRVDFVEIFGVLEPLNLYEFTFRHFIIPLFPFECTKYQTFGKLFECILHILQVLGSLFR